MSLEARTPLMAINIRHRDKSVEISRKHDNALIRTLRKTYGARFARGGVPTMRSSAMSSQNWINGLCLASGQGAAGRGELVGMRAPQLQRKEKGLRRALRCRRSPSGSADDRENLRVDGVWLNI